jgi:ABC-type multidrug transport system fused ATPase/permease subunit
MFFDPSTGSVTIDGVDIRQFSLKTLRRQIAMVLQPPLISPISVRDNLAYGLMRRRRISRRRHVSPAFTS